MKYFLLLILSAIPFYQAFSSSIQIVNSDNFILVPTTADEVKAQCIIKNVSNTTINVKMRYEPISITNGQEVAFCWGPICYPPKDQPFEPIDIITLEPGQVSTPNDFYATFYPNGLDGSTVVKFIIWVDGNLTDSVHWDVTFVVQIGKVENLFSNIKINSFFFAETIPNLFITNLVDDPISYSIFDFMGKNISNNKLNGDIDLSQLSDGTYILGISSNSKKYYIKFIKGKNR